MKFNRQLRDALKQYEKATAPPAAALPVPAQTNGRPHAPAAPAFYPRGEKVAGGEVLWSPIDRAAAMLLSRAPWYFHPPAIQTTPKTSKPVRKPAHRKKKAKTMKGALVQDSGPVATGPGANDTFIAKSGLTIRMVNGQPMFDMNEIHTFIIQEVSKLAPELNPTVKAAKDTRQILDELFHGIGQDMESFRTSTKTHLDEIRQTRFAMVTEAAHMTTALKDVRQFFVGSTYHDEMTRLKEFVGLCERLFELKKSGFLDTVADTMLRLAIK